MEYFDNRKIVLYIKNAEIFATEKRQVFLYTLLDHVNSFAKGVVIALASNNVLFTSFLEKRVKSRFNFKLIEFYEYPYEEGLLSILDNCLGVDTGICENQISQI